MLVQSDADMTSEDQCRSLGAISVSSIQLVARARRCRVEFQVRPRHAATKKADMDPADVR